MGRVSSSRVRWDLFQACSRHRDGELAVRTSPSSNDWWRTSDALVMAVSSPSGCGSKPSDTVFRSSPGYGTLRISRTKGIPQVPWQRRIRVPGGLGNRWRFAFRGLRDTCRAARQALFGKVHTPDRRTSEGRGKALNKINNLRTT